MLLAPPAALLGILPYFFVLNLTAGQMIGVLLIGLILSYIGGATDPDIAKLTNEELAEVVHGDLSKTLLVKEAKPRVMGVRRWEQAIPQYTLGHRQRIARMNEILADYPGVVLCSNYLDGVSLGDCVRRGEERAAELAEWLTNAEAA